MVLQCSRTHKFQVVCGRMIFRIFTMRRPHKASYRKIETREQYWRSSYP